MQGCLKVVVAISVLLVSSLGLAISEEHYVSNYEDVVKPFYESGTTGEMQGQASRVLRYIVFRHPNPKGSIVISEGYNESFRKYAEVAYDLYQHNYSVYILDHRGQGASDHFLSDSQKGYIDHFEYFALDLKKFLERVVSQEKGLPRFLLAHSLGGTIASAYLEKYPQDFQAAVLSSPMLEIDLGAHQEWQASLELTALMLIGRGANYAPGKGPYDPALLSFDGNGVTHSRARFEKNRQTLVENPSLHLGGQTVRWVAEGIRGSYNARMGSQNLAVPILLFQAGEDELVKPWGQNTFCERAMNCNIVKFPDAQHEILQEIDSIRQEAFTQIFDFFEETAP